MASILRLAARAMISSACVMAAWIRASRVLLAEGVAGRLTSSTSSDELSLSSTTCFDSACFEPVCCEPVCCVSFAPTCTVSASPVSDFDSDSDSDSDASVSVDCPCGSPSLVSVCCVDHQPPNMPARPPSQEPEPWAPGCGCCSTGLISTFVC